MAMNACPACHQSVSTTAEICPHCGAPGPASQTRQATGYEWKSNATFLRIPWIHVAWGKDARGKRRVAMRIIAIGQFAIGGITIAQFGFGTHVWSTGRKDPEALEYFQNLAEQIGVL